MAGGDVFMAANPTAASPRNFGDTLLAELNSDHSDQGKDGFKTEQKLLPTLNCKCINPLQVDLNASVDTNHWHMAAQDLLKGFLLLHNNLPA